LLREGLIIKITSPLEDEPLYCLSINGCKAFCGKRSGELIQSAGSKGQGVLIHDGDLKLGRYSIRDIRNMNKGTWG
jgi:hypothetical protein